MLKKTFRITKKKEFEVIFKQGRTRVCDVVRVKTRLNELPYSRFSVVVSAKISKKAVERNKIKRRLSAFLRINLNKIKPGIDFVFIVLPNWKTNSASENREKLLTNFKYWKFFINT